MKLVLTPALFITLALIVPAVNAESPAKSSIQAAPKPLSSMFQHKYYKFEGKYPLFTGTPKAAVNGLNKEIRDELLSSFPNPDIGWSDTPTPKDQPNSEYCDYTIKLLNKDYLSMTLTKSHCYSRAPHPVSTVGCYNYSLTPALKELKLKDLVGKKANYKLLTKMVCKTFNAPSGRKADEPVDFAIGADDTSFVFDKKGISWQWGDYAMGSYAGGARSGYLTFKQLSFIAEPNSRAAQWAK